MDRAPTLVDLSIALDAPPSGAASEVLANITLNCEMLGLSHQGDMLRAPLTQQERDDLHWYLERYPLWPYAEFVTRGQQIEAHLAEIGQRLYHSAFGSSKAASIVQAWNSESSAQHQVSVLSQLPGVLSLPWELLHDEQGFLALRTPQPVAIVRRLHQSHLSALISPIEPPLRILLVTARPDGISFFDPRGTARTLLDVLQEQIEAGSIATGLAPFASEPTTGCSDGARTDPREYRAALPALPSYTAPFSAQPARRG